MTTSDPQADVTDVVVELVVVGGPDEVDLASADLWAAGATAIGEVSSSSLGLTDGDGVGSVTLTASFPTATAARQVAAELGGTAVVVDRSWQEQWKAFAQPVNVSAGLVVVPAWRPVEIDDDRLVVRIDPGGCFGSGTHASTRFVLRWLVEHPPVAKAVLDVGCGSGILSVTAARLGAASVTAVDIDPEAVRITRSNAAENEVATLVDASTQHLDEIGSGFDLALVNVTAGVHAVLGTQVVAALDEGATVVVAGLLPGQWRHVVDAYPGMIERGRAIVDGWEGLVLQKLFLQM